MFKLLVDECLSPELVDLAVRAGHVESTCVRNRNWLGIKDHVLMQHVIEHDFTLVTRNSRDFRGPQGGPLGGLHQSAEIHAGLVCLNSEGHMDIDLQCTLFEIALQQLAGYGDLVNQALEISERQDGSIHVVRYEIPRSSIR
jgi:hypothetical protein